MHFFFSRHVNRMLFFICFFLVNKYNIEAEMSAQYG